MANNTLLFLVSSNESAKPQFQYVLDLTYSGSSTVLQTVKQQPNPGANGIFDVGSIISNYLNNDSVWKTQFFATSSNASKRFQIKFGEEYATSISGTALEYSGLGYPGNPAATASAYYYITNGLVDPNNKVNWNFNSQSYYDTPLASDGAISYTFQNTLSNAPITQSAQNGDYQTIALYNGNFNGSSTQAQDIFQVQINVCNAAGTNIQNFSYDNYSLRGGGPRENLVQLWSDVYTSQSAGTQLIHIGLGPQNLDDAGNTLASDWAYYNVTVLGQSDDYLENPNGTFAKLRINKQDANCGYNRVRFIWKNEFGVWDYFNFTLQTDSKYSIERNAFAKSFVDYSANGSTVPYSRERRGQTQYYNALQQSKTANSNWLTQAEADWLKELFFSANVYIQDQTQILPVVVTSVDLVEKTNPRTQRLFQYQIEFEPANQPNARL
jgi:hypothetical protein